MSRCQSCQRDTSPVYIGGQMYCADCGTPLQLELRGAPPAPPKHNFDLAPRTRTNVARAPQPAPSKPDPSVAPPKPAHHGTSAEALHGRAKPSGALDLRPAAVPAHAVPAAPPKATANERHQARFSDRFERAKQVEKSPHIQKFGAGRLPSPHPDTHHQSVSQHMHEPAHRNLPQPELPRHAATQHEAMTRLTPITPRPTPTPPLNKPVTTNSYRPHLGLSARANQTLATVAAVTLMGGYIWMHNYPKLALQNANGRAGISASLPAYLPSSYTLQNTDAKPGLITLNFSSPGSPEALKIAQARTSWDSSSLLDNYVTRHADDYATVQSQGLTIYLWGNNQAAWVNHGIWYSIEGASRLSREQILKIAYSL